VGPARDRRAPVAEKVRAGLLVAALFPILGHIALLVARGHHASPRERPVGASARVLVGNRRRSSSRECRCVSRTTC